jgi:hypothetical protein
MKGLVCALLATLALGACSRAPDAANSAGDAVAQTAADNRTSAPVAATGREPFAGRYRLEGEEGADKGEVIITKAGDDYTVLVDVGTPGCGGQAKGPATRVGEVLHLLARIEDTTFKCEMDLKRDGETLVVEEAGGCSNFHGARCDLNGTAHRK